MNGHCSSCNVERECGYPYKPTDCCNQRKFRPLAKPVEGGFVIPSPFEPVVVVHNNKPEGYDDV